MTGAPHKNGEILPLTGLRGVAACYVMLYHYLGHAAHSGAVKTFASHGYLAVDLFFVLSGFVMALTYAQNFLRAFSASAFAGFLYKRLGRVYPLYAVVTLLTIATEYYQGEHFTPWVLLCNALMIQSWGLAHPIALPAWSISTEFAAYLLFPMLVWAVLRGRGWRAGLSGLTAIAAIVLVATRTLAELHQEGRHGLLDVVGDTSIYGVLRCLGGFTLGLVAYRYYAAERAPALQAFPRAVSWLPARFGARSGDAAALLILALLAVPDADIAIVVLFPVLILALAEAGSQAARFLSSRPVYWLGTISYSLYLVHRLIDEMFRGSIQARLDAVHTPHAYTVSCVLIVPITFAFAAFTYYAIERPARDVSRRLVRKQDRTGLVRARQTDRPSEGRA
jgi:peptidoglycan/LPS O-acetylase OafA/YrhL